MKKRIVYFEIPQNIDKNNVYVLFSDKWSQEMQQYIINYIQNNALNIENMINDGKILCVILYGLSKNRGNDVVAGVYIENFKIIKHPVEFISKNARIIPIGIPYWIRTAKNNRDAEIVMDKILQQVKEVIEKGYYLIEELTLKILLENTKNPN